MSRSTFWNTYLPKLVPLLNKCEKYFIILSLKFKLCGELCEAEGNSIVLWFLYDDEISNSIVKGT